MSDKKPSTAVEPAAQIGERPSGLLTDSTLAPAPLRDLLAAEGASICMLSVDGELVDTVQESAGEQYPISAVASWPELLAVVEAHSCGIVLLDIELLETGLERRIEELKRIVPGLVVLVASPRTQAESLMNLLSERKIHRLLMKPAAVGITRLLIESAVSRYLELRGQVAERTAPVTPPAMGQRRGAIVAALILLVAAGAGAAWWLRNPRRRPSSRSLPRKPLMRGPRRRARGPTKR